MRKNSKYLVLIFSIYIISAGCASNTYIPKDIKSLDKNELCELSIWIDGFNQLKIDGFSYPRPTGFTKGFILGPGDHKLSGYFEEKLSTGDREVTVSQMDARRESSVSRQRSSSYVFDVINYKNVHKNPNNHPGKLFISDFIWYSIDFECRPNTTISLGDMILGADQFVRRANNK